MLCECICQGFRCPYPWCVPKELWHRKWFRLQWYFLVLPSFQRSFYFGGLAFLAKFFNHSFADYGCDARRQTFAFTLVCDRQSDFVCFRRHCCGFYYIVCHFFFFRSCSILSKILTFNSILLIIYQKFWQKSIVIFKYFDFFCKIFIFRSCSTAIRLSIEKAGSSGSLLNGSMSARQPLECGALVNLLHHTMSF